MSAFNNVSDMICSAWKGKGLEKDPFRGKDLEGTGFI